MGICSIRQRLQHPSAQGSQILLLEMGSVSCDFTSQTTAFIFLWKDIYIFFKLFVFPPKKGFAAPCQVWLVSWGGHFKGYTVSFITASMVWILKHQLLIMCFCEGRIA